MQEGLPGASTRNLQFSSGSEDEIRIFKKLQRNFAGQYEWAFPDKHAPKTVVIVPSLTLDQEILSKVKGQVYYEERMLCLLMLLRMPKTHVIFVTSVPVDPAIVDYYLHLLPGITGYHARQRLTLLSCYDPSPVSLTQKVLDRPLLLNRIQKAIQHGHSAHLACFNVTHLERTLAVKLGIPIFGCDPDLYSWGTKSRSRDLFRRCNLPLPDGYEDIRNENEIIAALAALKRAKPALRKAVIKMNDGFSGEGNAIFSYEGSPEENLETWIADQLPRKLVIIADDMNYTRFMLKFEQMRGIVEEFIEGAVKTSPSVQCRINPLGGAEVVSTHDQVLGGESNQVFLGASFPADPVYNVEIGKMGKTVAEFLRDRGVLGRFSVDFLSVQTPEGWNHYAIEINLRKGGTTHPFLMLQFLTGGEYNYLTGVYTTANGQSRSYYTTDNLKSDKYRGITPHDLIDIAICNELHYDASSQEGVTFHIIGALSQFGKIGLLCIGKEKATCDDQYRRVVQVMDHTL
jgi:hypothetical protein